MTPQEQQMIDGLIDRIRNTQLTDRDPEAAAHLQQGLGSDPDAIYILAQTVLVQQQALLQAQTQLQAANAQIATLRDAAGHPPQQPAGSWLDRFFGSNSATPNQPQPPTYQQPVAGAPPAPYGVPPYFGTPAQPYPQQAYPPQGYAYAQPQGGGFLRNAVQTAAGVAAGAFLFEGVESMFGGHSYGGYGGGGTTINNYYEDRPATEHHETSTDSSFYDPSHDASRDLSGSSTAASEGLSSDVEDRRDFADNGGDSGNDNYDSTDDSSSSDDSSSFDDGGSGGDNGSF